MSIYSNENIRKIAKLSPREFPHLVQNRENYGVYSIIVFFISKLLKNNHFRARNLQGMNNLYTQTSDQNSDDLFQRKKALS